MSLFEMKAEVPAAESERMELLLQEWGRMEWSLLEDVIGRQAWVVGIFPNREAGEQGWAELRAELTAAGVATNGAPVERELADEDWKDSYKAHFKAWKFGLHNWVPLWERDTFKLPEGEQVLWLDPGMAFGTGNHETTRLCCERLVKFAEEKGAGGRVVDAGCGSGILALSAAKLGFGRVEAFDNDPVAIEVSQENGALNGLDDRVDFHAGDLVTGLAGREADLVLANIQADVLIRFACELLRAVTPGGLLVMSGILTAELPRVRETFAGMAPGWEVDSRTLGEWSDLTLRRPD